MFTGFVGGIAGIPPITSLTGAGAEGLSLRQTYTVTMVKNGKSTCLNDGQTLYAVPSNVGPLTMPNYQALFGQGVHSLGEGIRVWAGTADDPFFIDLGAFFDSVNFRSGVGPILSPSIDADNTHNYAPDAVGGYNVNSIVLEVPIAMLTVDGKIHSAGDKRAVIGTYGATSRHHITVRRSPNPDQNYGCLLYTSSSPKLLSAETPTSATTLDRHQFGIAPKWSLDRRHRSGNDTRERPRRIRRTPMKILAEKLGQRSGDLGLSDRNRVRAFTKRVCIWTHNCNPDVLRSLLPRAVFFPLFQPAASAVIGRNDERRLVAVLRHRLHRVPQLSHELVELVSAFKHQIVSPRMSPIVGFSVTDEKQARMG